MSQRSASVALAVTVAGLVLGVCVGGVSMLGSSFLSSPASAEQARGDRPSQESGKPPAAATAGPRLPRFPRLHARPSFPDVSDLVGVRFTYFTDKREDRFFLPEIMGGGAAWLDYDADGWLDLFVVNGCVLPDDGSDSEHTAHLFRNSASGSFAVSTRDALLLDRGYGQGVCTGDFNNDGFPDIYVTHYGSNRLHANNGDGTFSDVTVESRVASGGWSTSCAFGDLDRDGDLDLYVTHYVETTLETHPKCTTKGPDGQEVRCYCGPDQFQGELDSLFANEGDGTFADVTSDAGCSAANGKGLAVTIADLDNDGWPDVYVANDMVRNLLFRNEGAKGEGAATSISLVENGMAAGVALQGGGHIAASMGIACADYDANGWLDLYISNYLNLGNTLFQNREGLFFDSSTGTNLRVPSLPYLGFGALFLDYDNDGWLDLFVTNGHVLGPLAAPPIRMRGQLYHNTGGEAFEEVTDLAGPYFQYAFLGRGVAMADFTNSGAAGLAVVHQDDPLALLRNDTNPRGDYLGLELIGASSNRTALNTRVTVSAGSWRRISESTGGGSYLSDQDHRLLLGLGQRKQVDELEVRWPSGRVDRWNNLATNQYWLLVEGRSPRPKRAERPSGMATR